MECQTISDYPKSSCQCYDCTNKLPPTICEGIPTNLAVFNCKVPNSLDCVNTLTFRQNNQPTDQKGYYFLNPAAYTNKLATDFIEKGGQFMSTDPRLIDAPLAQTLTLDTVPMDSSMKLCSIYTDPRLCNYGKGYKTYSDITAGQILYYVDESISDAYFSPNFVSTASIDSYVYQDPMSSLKPRYDRYPLTCDNKVLNIKDKFKYCLSSMEDTTNFREDIMSKQMSKRNEQSWTARWAGAYAAGKC